MRKIHGSRTTKAATPTAGRAVNLQSRIPGQNLRAQKLTEGSGTNPSKIGGATQLVKTPMRSSSGLSSDTAAYKHDIPKFNIDVGGPGFDEIKLKTK